MKKLLLSLLFLLISARADAGLEVCVGQGAMKTSTGTQAYTCASETFTPIAIIFNVGSHEEADGQYVDGAHSGFGIGFATGTTQTADNFFMNFVTEGGTGGAPHDSYRMNETNSLYSEEDYGSSPYDGFNTTHVAHLDSFDSGGFTMDFTTASGTAYIFNYMIIGGSGISAFAGSASEGATTGSWSETGVGFEGDFGFFISAHKLTAAGTNNGSDNSGFVIGMALSSTEEVSLSVGIQGGQSTANFQDLLVTDNTLEYSNDTNSTSLSENDFTSFDSDGFTMNRGVDDTTDSLIYYLILDGIQGNVTGISQKTSTGTTETTGVGFQPIALFYLSNSETATHTGEDLRFSFGMATNTGGSETGHTFYGNQQEWKDNDASWRIESDEIWSSQNTTDGSYSDEAEAHVSAWGSDGFTTSYTVTDATARLIKVFSLGDTGGGASNTYSSRGVGRGVTRGVMR